MNIKQMKRALSTFRAADVSIIKDDALRAKAQKLQAKQQGFTLLELLVVITLLATLAVGAMVAYDGIGENAKDVASANNIAAAERAIRTYRAIEDKYPEQWDNLANVTGNDTSGGDPAGMGVLRSDATSKFFGQWALATAPTTGSIWNLVGEAMEAVGIEEFQAINEGAVFDTGYVPNLALNESYPLNTGARGSELEMWKSDASGAVFGDVSTTGVAISIVPSASEDPAACTADGASIAAAFDGSTVINNARLNLINDALDDDACSIVLAVGFGKDVPGTTIDSRVAISVAPTATSTNINPSTDYARYIALFQVAEDNEDTGTVGVIEASEVFSKARLIAVVDTEGRVVDQAIAGATAEN